MPASQGKFFLIVKNLAFLALLGAMAYFAFNDPDNFEEQGYQQPAQTVADQSEQTTTSRQDSIKKELKTYTLIRTFSTGLAVPKDMTLDQTGKLLVVGDELLVTINPITGQILKKTLIYQRPVGVCCDRWGTAVISRQELLYCPAGKDKFQLLCNFSAESFLTAITTNKDAYFVANAGLGTIHEISRAGNFTGEFVPKSKGRKLRFAVSKKGEFDVAAGKRGDIWATNPGKGQILSFTIGDDFNPELTWGEFGEGISDFTAPYNPTRIAIMPDMNFVVSQINPPNVRIFNDMGSTVAVVADDETLSPNSQILDVVCNSMGTIYLLDDTNSQVLVYRKQSDEIKNGNALLEKEIEYNKPARFNSPINPATPGSLTDKNTPHVYGTKNSAGTTDISGDSGNVKSLDEYYDDSDTSGDPDTSGDSDTSKSLDDSAYPKNDDGYYDE